MRQRAYENAFNAAAKLPTEIPELSQLGIEYNPRQNLLRVLLDAARHDTRLFIGELVALYDVREKMR